MKLKKSRVYYRYYPPCLYFLLDRWLCKMSRRGLHLTDHGTLKYVFEERKPTESIYLSFDCSIYPSHFHKGSTTLQQRHPNIAKNYGKAVKPRKPDAKTVVLVSPDKIDKEYYQIIRTRNRLGIIESLRDIAIIAGVIAVLWLIR